MLNNLNHIGKNRNFRKSQQLNRFDTFRHNCIIINNVKTIIYFDQQ